MLVKLKYIGTDETGLTQNNVYPALAIVDVGGAPHAVIIDDAGVPYSTKIIADTTRWELVSVETIGAVYIYP